MYLYYLFVLIIYLMAVITASEALTQASGWLALSMFFLSFYRAGRLFQILGGIFVALGVILYGFSAVTFMDIPHLLSDNLTLVAFVSALPFIQTAVRAGRYDKQLQHWLFHRVESSGYLNQRSLLTSYGLVPFMNLSVLPLIQSTLARHLQSWKKGKRDAFISRVTLRGFALVLVWMPMEIMLVLALDLTGAGYIAVFPWFLLISVTMLLIEIIRGYLWKNEQVMLSHHEEIRTRSSGKVWTLLLAIISFLVIVVGLGELLDFSFILMVTLVIPPFAWVWASICRRRWRFQVLARDAFRKQLEENIHPFVVLFVSLGWFTGTLSETPVIEWVQAPFETGGVSPAAILAGIPLAFIAMAMVGIHPIATMTLLHEVVGTILMPISPESLTIVYVVAALATFTVSTYGITVTLTARHTEQNPYRITLRNMPFALVFSAVGVLAAILLL
ncbi:hypothetical protein HNR44_000026 [Geomicrobium halophilum]|uniref:Uncharacterized protein n=1 Tax=Geomicrobium halophilum TaxID=549000 RepID=A0A841PGQ8_9BACL|nr:hypothetical protein [Geomicrobium halophilum]MBB6448077.1 hypothetical protein [Geomicrobium halophilum]